MYIQQITGISLLVLAFYLIGSIPFALLFTKLFASKDIRDVGSGNVGATNVLRTGHKGAAVLTLLCDFLKGFYPCAMLYYYAVSDPLITPLYLIPVLGHIYPVWLRFKGGKGVATGLGVIFAFSWVLGLWMVGLWILVAVLSRRSSASGLFAFMSAPFISWYLYGFQSSLWLFALALLILYTHRDNMKRLMQGQEPKIGEK